MDTRQTFRTTAGLLAAGLVLSACSGSREEPQLVESGITRTESASEEQLEAIYERRMEEARSRYTQADVDFMTGMIAHHAQALVMSALAPEADASPELRRLTARIINAQRDEIATMQNWLRDRGQDVPEVEIDGTVLTITGVEHRHHMMPGMLTQAQLDELAAARGPEFDRLFLTYMIQHHEGAVSMVHDLFESDGAANDELAFKVASDIQVDQITEINRMKLMLESLSGTDPDRR